MNSPSRLRKDSSDETNILHAVQFMVSTVRAGTDCWPCNCQTGVGRSHRSSHVYQQWSVKSPLHKEHRSDASSILNMKWLLNYIPCFVDGFITKDHIWHLSHVSVEIYTLNHYGHLGKISAPLSKYVRQTICTSKWIQKSLLYSYVSCKHYSGKLVPQARNRLQLQPHRSCNLPDQFFNNPSLTLMRPQQLLDGIQRCPFCARIQTKPPRPNSVLVWQSLPCPKHSSTFL